MERRLSPALLLITLICLYTVLGTSLVSASAELIVMSQLKVSQGKDIFKLACPRSDKPGANTESRFGQPSSQAFESVVWLLHEQNILVGAGVQYDHSKYHYVPATGELAIRNVDYNDAGIYRCIIKYGKTGSPATARHETSAVQLIVKQPYANLWEEEYKGNLIRAIIAASIAACLLSMCCAVYKFRWREPNYMRYSSTDIIEVESGLENPGLELELQHGVAGSYGEKLDAEHRSRARSADPFPASVMEKSAGNSNQGTTSDTDGHSASRQAKPHVTRI